MDLKEIKAIIDLMRKNSLTEFELEKPDFKIKLKRGAGGFLGATDDGDTALSGGRLVQEVLSSPAGSVPAGLLPGASAIALVETEINSPTIGTFYRAPSPDAAPYVEIGSEVGPETVVCLIEAMKVMSEIKAEARGVVTAVLAENGKPVEFGQALFKLRPV
jgi:acetyl-CoA carboxylase biotin carboxyl carrier protein